MPKCPHTMKASDREGVTRCCDCGKTVPKTKNANKPMTENQIKHMVTRFLAWHLPRDFNPDAGIKYTRSNSPGYANMPTGTNLLDAGQADAMVRHIIEGMS